MKKIIFVLSVFFVAISCSSDKEIECVCEFYVTTAKESGSGDTTYNLFRESRTAEDGNCLQFNGKWENNNTVEERVCEPED